MITLLNPSQEERRCDLITKPPSEQGMGVRETCLADVLFLGFNCELAGRVGERKQHCLPPGSLQVLLVGVRYGLRSTWRVFCHSIPSSEASLEEPALPHMSLKLSKAHVHQYRVLPSESPAALRAADGPMLVQTCSSMSKLVRKPTQPDGFIHPSDKKRNAHASTFTFRVFTGRLGKQQMAASVSASKSHKYPSLNNPVASCRPRARSCVFKKFMGPALLWNAEKHKRWSLKSRAKNAQREDSLGLR